MAIITTWGRYPSGEPFKAFPYNVALDYANVVGTQSFQYRRRADGRIELRGITAKTTNGAANDVIGTLPAGYRPSNATRFAVPHNTAIIVVEVTSAGVVRPKTGTTAGALIDFTGVSFYPT